MIAALPMYERPETRAAHDAFWALIRDALRAEGMAAPEALDRATEYRETWVHPALVLGQTCGMPYRTGLYRRVTLVATPDYGLPDTPPGHYRSVFVVRATDPRARAEDFAGARLAYNEGGSHSGWAAPQIWAAERGLAFRPGPETGAHRASARAVAAGEAEIAALDAVTWRGIQRWEPELAAGLRVAGVTGAAPGLPYIAAAGADGPRTAAALAAAVAALTPADRETLGLRGIVAIPAEVYLAVPTPPPPVLSPA